MDKKKIQYNGTRLQFTEELSGYGTVLRTTDGAHAVYITESDDGSGMDTIVFNAGLRTRRFRVLPVGDVSQERVIALAQCYYVDRYEAEIGDLEGLSYYGGGMKYQHSFERDGKYDQPILIHLDQL